VEPPCRVGRSAFTDTANPRQAHDFFRPEQLANPYHRDGMQEVLARGRSHYTFDFEVDGTPLPSTEIAAGRQALAGCLVAVRQQVLAEFGLEQKLAELEAHRQQLERRLLDAQDAAAQARGEAARLAGKGQDATEQERTALEKDERVRTLTEAVARLRTADDVRAALFTRLESRLQAEAAKIRAEVGQRQSDARRWLTLAVSGQELPSAARGRDLLREVTVADELAVLVQQATPGAKARYGTAAEWLDREVVNLTVVPGYQRPRSVFEVTAGRY
jgi:hypothetical protein